LHPLIFCYAFAFPIWAVLLMRLLFITDQLPFPPRNGVTIPLFHYLKGLSETHKTYLIYTPRYGENVDLKQLENNHLLVEKLWMVPRQKSHIVHRVKAELCMREMGFNGWQYDEKKIKQILFENAFDVIWISPITVADIFEAVFKYCQNNPVMIAGISDCTTAFMRNNAKRAFLPGTPVKRRLLCAVGWIRSWLLAYTERRILDRFDLVLAQTTADVLWLRRISDGKLTKKSEAISNGVDPVLFDLSLGTHSDILYMANLEAAYGNVAFWLLNEVWPMIRHRLPKCRFVIVGKGAPQRLLDKIASDDRVVYHEFVPNLIDVYKGKGVSLSPSFKNYGLINKVVEAMAAGIPVVGDSGSFNGIDGFKNGQHGIIASGARQMGESVVHLLTSPRVALAMADGARYLVNAQFNWNDRILRISQKIESLKVNGS
jgi:polysaccharide biosynthesis protein PslH